MKKGFDYIGVTTVYFCHDGKGNFIMAKRSKQARDENGRWDIGGGGMEFGDTVEKTLQKEIKEEYNTDVLDFEFLGIRDVHRKHEGQKTHWIALDYKVLVDPKIVKNNEPHKFDEIKWFRMDNIPPQSELHSVLPEFLEKYKNKLN
ncbi:MAG: RNA pyrophosphohydrolase [Candidatus Doudnabacteria bacterium CG10_big_fil_rev_8_21_14_0_10_41_10]|uniref:RNA pyrophosphohydrolase n=1 Tax=Candidatus Doudnabacteria bacterium CG10_big_fil_rev_8_21_14_0_10_41_10 TaxID=1974551 RepID=A0A2H0VC69_9BACT|nr:MAG: RNA pyrophosphohydrolase [Candidatus Doudnabacteria bacterium CG10_big_fil_rev_8_21_14_0_10_41_10]